jgi:hypothetical protein
MGWQNYLLEVFNPLPSHAGVVTNVSNSVTIVGQRVLLPIITGTGVNVSAGLS